MHRRHLERGSRDYACRASRYAWATTTASDASEFSTPSTSSQPTRRSHAQLARLCRTCGMQPSSTQPSWRQQRCAATSRLPLVSMTSNACAHTFRAFAFGAHEVVRLVAAQTATATLSCVESAADPTPSRKHGAALRYPAFTRNLPRMTRRRPRTHRVAHEENGPHIKLERPNNCGCEFAKAATLA